MADYFPKEFTLSVLSAYLSRNFPINALEHFIGSLLNQDSRTHTKKFNFRSLELELWTNNVYSINFDRIKVSINYHKFVKFKGVNPIICGLLRNFVFFFCQIL
uniref:Uncharacterized protein n=1 Tax=Rhizophagus irregularis (strain DAOM 181602 / DAOM 197198 / MUCL 43194) TaxID=747089 RepID=U9UTJ5_RHIID